MEPNSWPGWLKMIWPNWLESIGYPLAGVGDLDDLKLSLGVGQDGKWIGFVNPGWYYHANSEQYNYVSVGTILVSGASGAGTVYHPISFRPSWGPILVQGITQDATGNFDGPYRQHNNSFSPAIALTWSQVVGATSYLVASLPTSALLVSVRDITNLPLGYVAGVSGLTNDRLYYYDMDNNKVYIKPKDPTDLTPDIWADLLYTYPLLRFREIVVSETDASGNKIVNPTYSQIENVKLIRGYTTVTVTGFHSSGSITHSISGTYDNDWVVLDYWISKSFILLDHKTIEIYCGGAAGSGALDTFTIYNETSIPDVLPNITVNVPASGIYNLFNVNPLFEFGYRSGYLFHGQPASAINNYWIPNMLSLTLDKDYVCKDFSELLKLKIMVTADNDLPLPYYAITVTVTGGSSVIKMPSSGITNGRGEVHYLIRPDTSGSSAIVVMATCGSLTASALATIVASSSLINDTKWSDGFVHVLVTNDKTGRGGFRAFVTATAADGLPRDNTVHLTSKLSSEFQLGDSTLTQVADTPTILVSIPNIAAIAEVGYVPQANDSLVGYSNTAVSKIIKGEANVS